MKKTKKSPKPFHLLSYVEDSNPKVKKFSSTKALGKFMDKFLKKHPDYMQTYAGSWIDFSVTNVAGRLDFYTSGIELE